MQQDGKAYRKYNRVPDLIRAEIISLYSSGKSSPFIANKFNISPSCVRKILREFGCPVRDNHKFKSVEKDIVADYRADIGMMVIARKYKTSNGIILKIIKAHGLDPRPKGNRVGEKNALWKGGDKRKAERMLAYVNRRYINEPLFRLEQNCRNRITRYLKTVNVRKKKRTIDMLGADWLVVRQHIESQFKPNMAWNNHGRDWHIDHIIPLASAKTEEELLKLFHYTNLQPLWAKDNLKKSSFHEGIHYRAKLKRVL